MTTKDEVLKMTLGSRFKDAKPVAYRYRGNLHEFDPSDWATEPVTFLYENPTKEWIGLTDKEIEKCWKAAIKLDNEKGADITNQPFYHLAKIVEKMLMEKNNE